MSDRLTRSVWPQRFENMTQNLQDFVLPSRIPYNEYYTGRNTSVDLACGLVCKVPTGNESMGTLLLLWACCGEGRASCRMLWEVKGEADSMIGIVDMRCRNSGGCEVGECMRVLCLAQDPKSQPRTKVPKRPRGKEILALDGWSSSNRISRLADT